MKKLIFLTILTAACTNSLVLIKAENDTQEAAADQDASWSSLPPELQRIVFGYVAQDDPKAALKKLNELEGVNKEFKQSAQESELNLPVAQQLIKDHPNTALKLFVKASASGDRSAVENFIKAGIAINALSPASQETALMAAAKNGKEALVDLLVERKVDVNAAGLGNNTALLSAAKKGHKKIIEKLLEHGAKLDARNAHGNTALELAAANGFKDLATYLIGKGAAVNNINVDRFSPVMLAAKNGHKDIVQLLIKHQAHMHTKNRQGKTAQALAQESGHTAIAQLLDVHVEPKNLELPTGETGSGSAKE